MAPRKTRQPVTRDEPASSPPFPKGSRCSVSMANHNSHPSVTTPSVYQNQSNVVEAGSRETNPGGKGSKTPLRYGASTTHPVEYVDDHDCAQWP